MRLSLHVCFRLPLLLVVSLLAGCQSVAYYSQAVHGQFSLLARRQPVDRLLADIRTPAPLKTDLERVQRIRDFAQRQLHLPAQRAYDTYVDLGRAYPVWAVMAAPELSLTPKTWCYWFVGCLDYRGFFEEKAARDYAGVLQGRGLDVYLGGVPAYSTLGWFRDPVLSSFVHEPEVSLAELVFHELTHQVVFVPGDTTFNESLAVTVAEAGVQRYAREYGLDTGDFLAAKQRREAFVQFVLAYRMRLQQLFESSASAEEKRSGRAALSAEMRQAYAAGTADWQRSHAYDDWFASLNNARLNTIGTYFDLVPAFRRLLQQEDGDIDRFMTACRALARQDKTIRRQRLEALRPAGQSDIP